MNLNDHYYIIGEQNMGYQIWLFVIFVYWILAALFARRVAKGCFIRTRKLQQREIPDSFKAFTRKNITSQHERSILRGCYLRFPLHFFLIGSYLIPVAFLALLKLYIKLPTIIVEIYRKHIGRLIYKICVSTVEQFNAFQKIQTPIIISNHTSWLETIYLSCFPHLVSTISKEQMRRMPIINILTQYIKCIYVKRQSSDSRLQAHQKIKDRVNKFNNKIEQSPLLIYPQGTVSNGKSLLKFKSGAFEPLSPITIISFEFQCQQFDPQMADVKLIECFLITLALRPSLRVKKAILYPNEGEEAAQYQQRCRQKMAQMGNFTIYEASFNELKSFMNFLTESSDGESKMK